MTVPAGLPPVPPPSPYRKLRPWEPVLVGLAAAVPLAMMGASVLVGGGPRAESADDALLTLAMRDAAHGHGLVGAYSRFGWHHPGPSYLYLAGVPTRLWGGRPTGSWIGAIGLGAACVVAITLLIRRWAGTRAGWWAAAVTLGVVVGVGPVFFRDPWNPYAVTLPMLFTALACGFAAAGARGALGWAAVGATLAVQTHVSTAPVVGGLLLVAAGAQVARRRRGRPGPPAAGSADIPGVLPPLHRAPGRAARPRLGWEQRVIAAILVLAWLPPAWDELFGTHNLTGIWNFFTSPHPTHGWDQAWRLVSAMFGVVLFQHHGAVHDGVNDLNSVVTTGVFVALAAAAIAAGVVRRRPTAVWLGVTGLTGAVLCVYSITRIVEFPYRYLLLWMAAIPALPVLGVVVGLGGRPRLPTRWVGAGRALTTVAVATALIGAVDAVIAAPPAAALTDRDIVRAWAMIQPVAGRGSTPVRLQLNDGARWPSAAGVALELERHGHPARVDRPWTLLFGDNRRAHGDETRVIIVASADPATWPPLREATPLGAAGRARYFVGQPSGASGPVR